LFYFHSKYSGLNEWHWVKACRYILTSDLTNLYSRSNLHKSFLFPANLMTLIISTVLWISWFITFQPSFSHYIALLQNGFVLWVLIYLSLVLPSYLSKWALHTLKHKAFVWSTCKHFPSVLFAFSFVYLAINGRFFYILCSQNFLLML
jgi:hypothetical protein